MAHRDVHPSYVDGCNQCKWSSVGVQTHRIKSGADPTRKVPVIAEEGSRAGQVVGSHVHHWDGRVDAQVNAPQVVMKTTSTTS